MNIARKLRTIRFKSALNQTELAALVGLHQTTISDIELGLRIRPQVRERLEQVLRCSPVTLKLLKAKLPLMTFYNIRFGS